MKTFDPPLNLPGYWLRCERVATKEVWFTLCGSTRQAAEAEKIFCEKQWPDVTYTIFEKPDLTV